MALGAMSPMAPAVAGPIVGLAGTVVGLSVLGQGLQSGMKIAKSITPKTNNKKNDKLMKKIWG